MSSQEQALHKAVRNGAACEVEKLLSEGTNINCLFYGWTPLQMAVDIGHQEMATLLISSGCDVEFHDANTKAPFEDAVIKKLPKVVEALLKKGISGDVILDNGHTPLTYAVDSERSDLVQVLVQCGVDINQSNSHGRTGLYLAARNGQVDLVKILLTAGADVNQTCKEDGGYTPLIAAAANEHKQIISLLSKQQGCNLDHQDTDGWTALWHAYSNSSDDICAILLRAGANKNLPNAEGCSVVQDARENEDEVMLELFQKYNNMV